MCVQLTLDELMRVFWALMGLHVASVLFLCFWVWVCLPSPAETVSMDRQVSEPADQSAARFRDWK